MATRDQYPQLIQQILSKRTYPDEAPDPVISYTIFDTKGDHYLLVNEGWRREKHRIYGTVIHADIRDGKIWIHWDGTEYTLAEELLEHGVPSSDIVIGYHAPYKRKYTEFAPS